MAGLPPSARLRRAADFAAMRKARGRYQGRCFALRWMDSATGHARLGLAVSRKVSKRAVERNRIKRVVRESFRARVVVLPPVDVLVIARVAAATTRNAGLFAELDVAWRRLAALKASPAPGTIGG